MNKLCSLDTLFEIRYGNQFDLYKLEEEKGYIDFVARGDKNNGVSAKVINYKGIPPFDAGLITVALGGSVLSSFVQQKKFYTAQNVKVLTPKRSMSLIEKFYYCLVIRQNRYRYSALGREANKTLNEILVPASMPKTFEYAGLNAYQASMNKVREVTTVLRKPAVEAFSHSEERVALQDLFTITYGINMELYKFDECHYKHPQAVPFVSRTEKNNGVAAFVEKQLGYEPNPAHTLSVAAGGSVLATFYQPQPYYSGRDLYYLTPKRSMTVTEMLYYAMVIRANRYRYSYGRQANKTLKHILVPAKAPQYLKQLDVELFGEKFLQD
jgi:Type I restriction modification DNA specificity domain